MKNVAKKQYQHWPVWQSGKPKYDKYGKYTYTQYKL